MVALGTRACASAYLGQGVLKVAGTEAPPLSRMTNLTPGSEASAGDLAVLKGPWLRRVSLLNKFTCLGVRCCWAHISSLISLVHRSPAATLTCALWSSAPATVPLQASSETLGALCSAYTVTDSTQ